MIDQNTEHYLVFCPKCQGLCSETVTILGTGVSQTVPCTTCYGLGRTWLTKEEADNDWQKEAP